MELLPEQGFDLRLWRSGAVHVGEMFWWAVHHSVEYEGFGTPKWGGGRDEIRTHEALKFIVWRQVDF